jgi:2'-5' RNA ligase
VRCFIAVDIDRGVRRGIADLQDGLRRAVDLNASEVKWVDPENIHLTLKFLGEVRDREINDVCRIVGEVAEKHRRFSIDIENVGTFGRPVRVVWAGVNDAGDLADLQGDLDERLGEAGWAQDRKQFKGHLTLCRVKSARASKSMQEIVAAWDEVRLGSVVIYSVYVYRSDLTNEGPIYTVVSSSSLRK